MTLPDLRFIALNQWLRTQLAGDFTLSLISGDASFRRYYRVITPKSSFIAVDSPSELVPVLPFVNLSKAYAAEGINVPNVIAFSNRDGFMLLSDLGDLQLGSCLNNDNVATWYKDALLLLPLIIEVTEANGSRLPIYDVDFVYRELAIFTDWLLDCHLKLTIDGDTEDMLKAAFSLLADNAIEQPKGGMHRDYHSRNLMVKDDELWVIDFQDAVVGPITYDAVSLLRDCYVRWNDALTIELMTFHFNLLLQYEYLPSKTTFAQYQRWFDLMGLQRHIKAAGIFARLHHRDGKSGYLKDIPLTLEYIRDISACYPELKAFHLWVKNVLIPSFLVMKE